jgi:hypothetical protein
MSINESTGQINQIAAALKDTIMEEIKRLDLDNVQLADRLGLLPSGVELLINRDYWSIETGLRIAEALNLGIELSVERR